MTSLEKKIRGMKMILNEICKDKGLLKGLHDQLDLIVNSARCVIDWEMKDKYEVGNYRGFTIIHHFLGVRNPYRVVIGGPPGHDDLDLFLAESEKDIMEKIDKFHSMSWRIWEDSPIFKKYSLDFKGFLFIRTEHFGQIGWTTDIEIFHRQQRLSYIPSTDLETVVGKIRFET